MIAIRRSLLTALALTAGSALALGLPAAAGAAPNPTAVPQYIIHFTAIALPAATTTGLQFRSTSCAITPATNPIVATCKETGTIKFATAGGSGSAHVCPDHKGDRKRVPEAAPDGLAGPQQPNASSVGGLHIR